MSYEVTDSDDVQRKQKLQYHEVSFSLIQFILFSHINTHTISLSLLLSLFLSLSLTDSDYQ